jgi:chemotaxis signal transduction protein
VGRDGQPYPGSDDADRESASSDDPGVQVVVLPLGDDAYAIHASEVGHVMASPVITSVPGMPAAVLGVCNVRGDVVPIVDTARLVGADVTGTTTHAVIVHTPEGDVGLTAIGVPSFGRLRELVGETQPSGQIGVHRIDDGVATLLDVSTLLTPERIRAP